MGIFRQKGPDLRRDYDGLYKACTLPFPVRKDLIYEGITTQKNQAILGLQGLLSERTWFTKGLRPGPRDGHFLVPQCQKGPDLRRDYDISSGRLKGPKEPSQKGPDLRRDYDAWTFWRLDLRSSASQNGPDLRRDYDEDT